MTISPVKVWPVGASAATTAPAAQATHKTIGTEYKSYKMIAVRFATEMLRCIDGKETVCCLNSGIRQNLVHYVATNGLNFHDSISLAFLKTLYRASGLQTEHPFNESLEDFRKEQAEGILWKNAGRLNFIKELANPKSQIWEIPY